MRPGRSLIIVVLLVTCIFFLATCIEGEKNNEETELIPAPPAEPRPLVNNNLSAKDFVGSAACASCHKNIYADHIKTAHFHTSDEASLKSVKGSFRPGKNSFTYTDKVSVMMEKRGDSLYQVEYNGDMEKRASTFDIVIGSGTKGQTFLNYSNNYLSQLPVSYFTAPGSWSNNPGYPYRVIFDRVITSRCLECHTTFAKPISFPDRDPEKFDKNKIVFGIDCERCHGPGAKHAAFQAEHPKDTSAKFIINPASFSRQQKLDLCGLCHAGRLQKTQPSFNFVAGDKLSDFFRIDSRLPDPEKIDVHGNQLGLLRASACFTSSGIMTCNTCHDPHKKEKGQLKMFSQKCMDCHTPEHNNFCKMEKTLGSAIKSNCVDCHMPVKPSTAIAMFLPGDSMPTGAQVRSHLIAVYPEESKKLIGQFMAKSNSGSRP